MCAFHSALKQSHWLLFPLVVTFVNVFEELIGWWSYRLYGNACRNDLKEIFLQHHYICVPEIFFIGFAPLVQCILNVEQSW